MALLPVPTGRAAAPPGRYRAALARAAIRTFRSLPPRTRLRLVRAGTPNYTVGAVVLLRDQAERILLVLQPPMRDWALPGGLLNRREDPVDGAVRELGEEVGITLAAADLTPESPTAVINARLQQIDVVFTATVDADTTEVIPDGIEIGEARWFPPDDLPPLTRPTARLLGHYGLGPDRAPDQGPDLGPDVASDRAPSP
jgi:ADP-ribose pyrophosphatase YjhB (NUDIX family)